MKSLKKYRTILWDFDGVILDSMPVRELGFRTVLKNYPSDQVEELIKFHRANGGWSRFVKLLYFFEKIRKEEVSAGLIQDLSKEFTMIMKSKLTSEDLLISDSLDYIKRNYLNFQMHIVSGSEHQELNFLCKALGIDSYFLSIHGSPTSKIDLISNLIQSNSYDRMELVLIGDSKNDAEAAEANKIDFFGYNNLALKKNEKYIDNFSLIHEDF